MNSSKSTTCLLDPIPSSLFKELLPILLHSFLLITNKSLSSGSVPSAFKRAIIKPLLQKNYLEKTNLPFMSKILERAVADQLSTHLSQYCLFEKFQSGFHSHHSTESALTRVANDLLLSMDANQASLLLLLLLNLCAAFHTIDHSILLNRLEKYVGTQWSLISWVQSYLSNKTQCVNYSNTISGYSFVNFGVGADDCSGVGAWSYVIFNLYASSW